jgi:hypothetical protein
LNSFECPKLKWKDHDARSKQEKNDNKMIANENLISKGIKDRRLSAVFLEKCRERNPVSKATLPYLKAAWRVYCKEESPSHKAPNGKDLIVAQLQPVIDHMLFDIDADSDGSGEDSNTDESSSDESI